jgi:predicted DNA-binding transcriptional regulator AlpA
MARTSNRSTSPSGEPNSSRPPRRLLREKQAREKLGGIGVTKFCELRKEDDFPQAVVVGPRCLAWDEAELDAWLASRPRVRFMRRNAA